MVQAVIMAGGEGSRLRPLTCDRPKPMVPVMNRPVMEHTVNLLKKHGINQIAVTLQYMPMEIINYFGDGASFDAEIKYFIEDVPLGTAGSVKNAAKYLKETFIVVSGDALTDFDLTEAIKYHQSKNALATLVLTPVEIPLEYGVVITEKSGEIKRFLEKPGWGEVFSDTVNTGIYILEPEVLNYIPEGEKNDFSKDLFPLLLKENKPLFGVSLNGYWCDIGNLKQYQEAHLSVLEGIVDIIIPGVQTGQNIFTGENCKIDPEAVISGPVVFGSNCYIGKGAVIGPYAVIGDNCRIEDRASIKRSVLWNGVYIGQSAEVRGAVLCTKTAVRNGAMLYEGAVIGDKSVIEEHAKIKPDTKIWPGKIVEKNTVVESHLIWGAKACRGLFGADGIAGKVNANLTPECASKLGAVYGNMTGTEAKVFISSDHHKSTHMIKTAVQAGLMSVGIEVIEGGILVTPVHRYAVKSLGVKGGIHIKSSSFDPEIVHVNFFTADGAAISRDMERKIENQFERDDFQRNAGQSIGTFSYMPGINEAYLLSLLSLVDTAKIKHKRFKLAAYYTGSSIQAIIPELFPQLGCEVFPLGIEEQNESSPEMLTIAKNIATDVISRHADLGIVFDRNAEHVVIIDEQGKVVNDDLFLALMSLIILDQGNQPVVSVPITGSSVVEKIAETKQGSVIRTKTGVVSFDALSTVVTIIEYMAEKDQPLSKIISEIPEFYMVKKQTDCPWGAKGKVMRRLVEESGDKQVELLDGVKVYHKDGWALILPDADEPCYHVYTEGYSCEFAESLADFYIDRIVELQKQ
jgi:mannose-1-phosphate guanylyltransferase/phosphomannomutase